MTTTAVLTRRYLAEAARTPTNLLILVLVPVVFVIVAAKPMADAAELLGGPGAPAVQTATAGWAAGFIAANAMYFQIRGSRDADRRLVLAGLPTSRLVAARMATGGVLALTATAAALAALAARTSITQPGRVIAGTLMFAAIYLAIGAVIGALVRNPVNGTVLVLFVWILDVFFGPALGATSRPATRILPTHYLTLWTIDLPSGHAGRPGDLGWALAWTFTSAATGIAVITATTRRARTRHATRSGSARDQTAAALRAALREAGRNRVLWVLLVIVPVVFVLLAVATTPQQNTTLTVREHGHTVLRQYWLPDVHGGTMAPIAIASLATLAGLFSVLGTRTADQRLTLAGLHPLRLLTARLTVTALLALVATAASLTVTATVFDAEQWPLYIAASALTALVYALIGALIGPLFGRVGGVLIAFLIPFLDLGIEQSPMLHAQPPAWAHALPGYGPGRVIIDAGLTPTFDETGALLTALAWLTALTAAALLLLRRPAAHSPQPHPSSVPRR
ncbi:ABC transporter permease [Kitasatospora sp. NPDC127111]|uniref:ABC transporter permease n=1 Tax=Kitasatospora sp. NPDC127111 TaxID=3345363 RepID=UPI00362CF897